MIKKQKIIKYIISFLCIIIVSSIISYPTQAATTGSIVLSSNYEIIEKGEEVEISVTMQNSKTGAFQFYLYFDDTKLDLISSPENTNVIGNRIIYVWYDENGGSEAKTGILETFKFKTKEDGIASFQIEGEFYSEIGQLIKTDFKGTQVQIGNTVSNNYTVQVNKTDNPELANTNLETLAIENVLLYPAFDTNITNYEAEVSQETINLNLLAIPENEQATVVVRGKEDLQEGDNTVLIQVTAPDGFTKKEYAINVHRRNLEEEQQYEIEQKENQKKLEEIYQFEKTSTLSNDQRKDNNIEEKKSNNWIVVGIAIVLIGAVFVLAKKYKNKK